MNNNIYVKHPRNDFIDYVKGVLIYLVTLGHVIQLLIYNSVGFYKDHLFKAIYIFHMPLFMAVAGYLSFNSLQKVNSFRFIYNRSVNLVLPIISWSIIAFTALAIMHHKNQYNIKDLFSLIFGSLWFLWALFFSSIVVGTCKILNKDNLIFAVFSSFFTIVILPDHHKIYLYKFMLPFFWAGYLFCKNSIFMLEICKNNIYLFLIIIASILSYYFWDETTYIYVSEMNISTTAFIKIVIFRYIAAIAVSLLFLFIISNIYSYFLNKQIIWMGKRSIYIYLIQNYVFALLHISIFRGLGFHNVELLSVLIAPWIALLFVYLTGASADIIERSQLLAFLFFGKQYKKTY